MILDVIKYNKRFSFHTSNFQILQWVLICIKAKLNGIKCCYLSIQHVHQQKKQPKPNKIKTKQRKKPIIQVLNFLYQQYSNKNPTSLLQ